MSKPEYPTREGLWSKGSRKEENFGRISLGLPYGPAVENFRLAIQGREDFDPAVMLVWGTMQATAVLNVLKAAEEKFGEAGQEMVRHALNQAGYESMTGMIDASTLPADIPETELRSFIVTGLNTILYASLEKPEIISNNRCELDILWCPHQDRYTPFDCRVQRYFVEGMLQALEDRGYGGFTAWVEQLIPAGAPRCHFVFQKLEEEGRDPWFTYSDELGRKALDRLKTKK